MIEKGIIALQDKITPLSSFVCSLARYLYAWHNWKIKAISGLTVSSVPGYFLISFWHLDQFMLSQISTVTTGGM